MNPGLLADVVRSEWTKLWSVRSTYWTILAAAVATIGLGALISWAAGHGSRGETLDSSFDPTSITLTGFYFSQLALGVMGVLTMTAEYSTGMIRTTAAAVPQRGYVLAAKAIVATAVSLVVGVIIALISFEIGAAIFGHYGVHVSLGQPKVARAVVGGGLYVAALTAFAVALGTIIRSSAATITALVAIVFVVPVATAFVPDRWQRDLIRYLPAEAGNQITAVYRDSLSLSAWEGFGVFLLWVLVLLAVARTLLVRRDV